MLDKLVGKNIFVTGADGFIGSHLVESLVHNGANVKALVYYNSWNSVGWLNQLKNEVLSHVEIVKVMCVMRSSCAVVCRQTSYFI